MGINKMSSASLAINPSTQGLKNTLRTSNGLPLVNTEFIHAFESNRYGAKSNDVSSMVKIISRQQISKIGRFEFHTTNTNYDLDYDLICFSDTAIQFLRSEVMNNNSPLWSCSKCYSESNVINGLDSIPDLLHSFLKMKNGCSIENSMLNVNNIRSLLRDLLDEKTLSFLSEVFPVANGCAFPMVGKEMTMFSDILRLHVEGNTKVREDMKTNQGSMTADTWKNNM